MEGVNLASDPYFFISLKFIRRGRNDFSDFSTVTAHFLLIVPSEMEVNLPPSHPDPR